MAETWEPGDLCRWRYQHKKHWQQSHVLGVMNDKDGSVRVMNTRTGFPAYVPNTLECIKRRK